MTEKKSSSNDTPSKIDDEPEQMRLWRQLIAIRDDLVAEIPRWESPDHPIKQYYGHVAAVYGAHGLTEWSLSDNNEQAKRRAERLRERLTRIDDSISFGTRDKSNTKRGISLEQLRKLVETEPDAAEKAARTALEKWWADRTSRGKRHVAQLKVWRLVTGNLNATPADFRELPDLDALYKADRKYVTMTRAKAKCTGKGAGKGAGTREACGRVIQHLRGRGVW